jgi:hypothetical protein
LCRPPTVSWGLGIGSARSKATCPSANAKPERFPVIYTSKYKKIHVCLYAGRECSSVVSWPLAVEVVLFNIASVDLAFSPWLPQTTSSSARLELATTGPRATTPRELSSSTQCWMSCAKKLSPVTACKVGHPCTLRGRPLSAWELLGECWVLSCRNQALQVQPF